MNEHNRAIERGIRRGLMISALIGLMLIGLLVLRYQILTRMVTEGWERHVPAAREPVLVDSIPLPKLSPPAPPASQTTQKPGTSAPDSKLR